MSTQEPGQTRGFTVLELLIVIAIVSILAALILSVAGPVRKKAVRAQALQLIQSAEHAAKSFQLAHNRWPWNADGQTLAKKLPAQDIFAELAPGNPALAPAAHTPLANTQKTEFLSLPASAIRNGRVIDPWGNELEFFWNPDTRSVVIVSAGPNGVNETVDTAGEGRLKPPAEQADDISNL